MLALAQQQAKPRKPAHVSNNDTLIDDNVVMSKEAYFAKLDSALREIEEGKCIVVRSDKELQDFFASL
ncbi:MAG: hypothetical protein LBT94_04460 [Prevotellaceae bacterium]|jgi:hypothetical protein|nr:hypothetical protein [Prevotellaceae bacterium]